MKTSKLGILHYLLLIPVLLVSTTIERSADGANSFSELLNQPGIAFVSAELDTDNTDDKPALISHTIAPKLSVSTTAKLTYTVEKSLANLSFRSRAPPFI